MRLGTVFALVYTVQSQVLHTTESQNGLTLSLSLLQPGFKKDLTLDLTLPKPSCRVYIRLPVTSSWFLDLDELTPLHLNLTSPQRVDVELPRSLSSAFSVEWSFFVSETQFTLSLPVHLRYNDPVAVEAYREVVFLPPAITAECGNETFRGVFEKELKVLMPVGRMEDRGLVTVGTFGVVGVGFWMVFTALIAYNSRKSKAE